MDFQRKLKFPLYDESGDRHSESTIVEKCIISEAITGLFVSGLTERKLHQVNDLSERQSIALKNSCRPCRSAIFDLQSICTTETQRDTKKGVLSLFESIPLVCGKRETGGQVCPQGQQAYKP